MPDADYVIDFFEWIYAISYPSTGHYVTDAWLEDNYTLNTHSVGFGYTMNYFLRERAELSDLFRTMNFKDKKRAMVLPATLRHSTAIRYLVLQILDQYMSQKPVLEKHRKAILRMLSDKVGVFHLFDAIISEVIQHKDPVETDAFIFRITKGEEQGVLDEIGEHIRKYVIYLSGEREGQLADLLPRFAAETILSALRCSVISPDDLAQHSSGKEVSFVF